MITVIIPVLNEEKTIGNVVRYTLKSPGVNEVIVVDAKSFDKSVEVHKRGGSHCPVQHQARKRYIHERRSPCSPESIRGFP